MANHHSFQKSFTYRVKQSNISTGLSKSLVNESNKMDSTRILDSGFIESNQEGKRRCFEKLVERKEPVDAKCGFEVDLIDDTALIEATGSVSGVIKKGGFKKESDGKKKKNKGCKKQDTKCSMKRVNEKKCDGGVGVDRVVIEKTKVGVGKSQKCDARVVEDRTVIEKKKVSVGKSQKVFRKKFGKEKSVYRRKDAAKIPELVETGVEDLNVPEKIVQETEVNLNVSNIFVQEKESTVELVKTEVNLDVSNEIVQEKESTVELVETETANEKDDIEVCTENVCRNPTVEPKKIAYSRGELEALRFVNGEGQKSKWIEVYGAFSPLVAKEYAGLVVDVNNRLTQRYNNRVVNCGSGYTRLAGNAILSMPPIFPMCSTLVYRRVEPYDRVGLRANYY